VDHGETGFVYSDERFEEVIDYLEKMSVNRTHCYELGLKGQRKLNQEWSTQVAAQRLIQLSKGLIANKDMRTEFTSGPCSADG
jgi:hypothetical protein